MSEGKYKTLLRYVKEQALLNETKQVLEKRAEWTSERSMGNYDDCFSDGQDCADASTALNARALLQSLDELK